MKTKFLLFVFASLLIMSCSQDKMDGQENLERIRFNNTDIEIYKGVFTTSDASERGVITITIDNSNHGNAALILNSGETITLTSDDGNRSNLNEYFFSGQTANLENVVLTFSVDANRNNPVVNKVKFNNADSNILIARHTARSPAAPITGTYDCTNCSTVYGGFNGANNTFNILAIGNGNQQFMTQVTYAGTVYSSPQGNNSQSGCSNSNGFRTCNISGTSSILGYTLNWAGTHRFPQGGGPNNACSELHGTWSMNIGQGTILGTFDSDTVCN